MSNESTALEVIPGDIENAGLTIEDLSELGIQDFSMNKDDLMFLVEEAIKESMAQRCIDILAASSDKHIKAFNAVLDEYIKRARETYFPALREALEVDHFPVPIKTLLDDYSIMWSSEDNLPTVDDVLLWVHPDSGNYKRSSRFLKEFSGGTPRGLRVEYADGDWTCTPLNGDVWDTYVSSWQESTWFHHISNPGVAFPTDDQNEARIKAKRSIITHVTKDTTAESDGVRTTNKSVQKVDIDAGDLFENLYDGENLLADINEMSKELNLILRKFGKMSYIMDRAKSRLMKNLIGASGDARADKLSFLIRSIAQKPIKVLEAEDN